MLRPRSHGKSRWTRGFRSSWHPHNPSNDAKIAPDFFQRRNMQKCNFLPKSASQYAQRENAHFTKYTFDQIYGCQKGINNIRFTSLQSNAPMVPKHETPLTPKDTLKTIPIFNKLAQR